MFGTLKPQKVFVTKLQDRLFGFFSAKTKSKAIFDDNCFLLIQNLKNTQSKGEIL